MNRVCQKPYVRGKAEVAPWWLSHRILLPVVASLVTAGALRAQSASPVARLAVPIDPVQENLRRSKTSRSVTLSVRDSTLLYVIQEIGRQAGLRPVYQESPVLNTRVAVSLTAAPAMDAFAKALTGTGLLARLSDNGETVVIRPVVKPDTTSESAVLTGRVVDSATNTGVSGVAVTVQGTKNSAVTDAAGNFTIRNIPPGEYRIALKALGYTSTVRTVKIVDGKPVTINVILKTAATALSGVVTTATGLQRKLEIGNSIASINVDSVIQVAPVRSLTDLLESRVPGLTVQRTSGVPGDPARIRIRGASSIERNNDPVFIVDGIRVYGDQSTALKENLAARGMMGSGTTVTPSPSPVDQIDINTIETIDVFKGPSAAAMYGSDAANGVIVIKTKRGQVRPARVTMAVDQSLETLPGEYPVGVFRFGHYNGWLLGGNIMTCGRVPQGCIIDSVVQFQALNDPRFSIIANGGKSGVSSSVSGGSRTLQYSMTGSWNRETGMLKLPSAESERFRTQFGRNAPHWMRRPLTYSTWGASGSLNVNINERTSINVTTALLKSMQQRSSLESAIRGMVEMYLDPATLGEATIVQDFYRRAMSEALTSRNTIQLQWTPFSWMPLNATAGLNTAARTDQAQVPRGLIQTQIDSSGRYSIMRASDLTRSLNMMTAIPLTKLRMSLALGFNGNAQSVAALTARTDQVATAVDVPSDFPSGNLTTVTQNTSAGTSFGWFMEPKLNLTSRFFVMPGLRLDQNGIAGASAGLLGLPKMNFSWIASDESFFPWRNVFDLFRLRTAFGIAGRQPGATDRLRLYGVDAPQNFNGWPATFTIPGDQRVSLINLGNTKLRPERTLEVEGGVDADLWHERLGLVMTYWRKTTQDAIIDFTLAPSIASSSGGAGVSTRLKKNIGVVRNTGWELGIRGQILELPRLSWHVDANLGGTNNKVVRLNPGQTSITIGSQGGSSVERVVPGYPLSGRWVYPIAGFADADGNGVIDFDEVRVSDSLVYAGSTEPDYMVTLNSSAIVFGRVTLNASLDYTHGATVANRSLTGGLSSPLNVSDVLSEQAAFMALFAYGGRRQTEYGFIQTISTLRFLTFSVGYSVPEPITRRFGGRSLMISLQGENLGTKTNYRGKDPNVTASVSGNSLVDDGRLPLPRILAIRIQMGN